MKKAIKKAFCILSIIGGILIGAIGHGLLAYIGGTMLAYIGILGLLGKKEILYY